MLAWANEHVELLSFLTSLGMLLIWLLYLSLFYRSHRRQLRANLLIHQASGFGLDSMCVLANMSESNVHVSALIVDAERADERASFLPAPSSPDPLHADAPMSSVHQGPLPQGQYFIVGHFRSLVAEAERRLPGASRGEPLRVTVRVAGFVGSELLPVGARRTFEVRAGNDGIDVRPTSIVPEQLSERRQRNVVREWLEEARAMDPSQVATFEEDEEDVARLTRELEERSTRD